MISGMIEMIRLVFVRRQMIPQPARRRLLASRRERHVAAARQQKSKLSDRLADEIIAYINDHKLTQGDKLPNEAQLMEITGAGRSSVREAMKLLASRNIVTIKQGSGTYVAQTPGMTADPLGFAFIEDKVKLAIDMLEIRQILEPEIAAVAAMRATDEDAAGILALCDEYDRLHHAGKNVDDVDSQFHEAISLASKNIIVPRIISTITASVKLSIELTHRERVTQSAEEHRIIAEAIAQHNPIAARDTMYTHVYASRQRIKRMAEAAMDGKDEPYERPTSPFMRSLESGMQGVIDDLFGTYSNARTLH